MAKLAAGLLVVTLGVTLTGQQASPTFKSAVNAVTLDVRVVDETGRFIDDLTSDDLQVFEDGRAQTITSFNLVDIPIRPDERPLFAGQPVDADVASNAAIASGGSGDGRLYVLLLDDLRTDPTRSANVRAQARDFIEHHFTESDRAVVLTTSGRLKVAQEFTNNRERLLKAIDQFEGGFDARTHCGVVGLSNGPPMDTRACACADDRTGFQSLSAVASWLVPVNGRRKALLLFGEGLASAQAANPPGASGAAPATFDPDLLGWILGDPAIKATCGDGIAGDQREAAGNAARANMTVYPLDPRRNADATFTQIVTDTSSYYLLGYVPTNDKRDGTFRKLDVRARRPGLTVQARTGYTARNDAPPKRTAAPALPPALTELMATPIPTSGLTMSVAANTVLWFA
jgi:VWFA-related protein